MAFLASYAAAVAVAWCFYFALEIIQACNIDHKIYDPKE